MEQIERIKYMEQLYDYVYSAVYSSSPDFSKLKSLQSKIDELSDYYTNGLWLNDYTADEKGMLPANLKRGVLSQDGLYNLLQDTDALLKSNQNSEHKVRKMKKIKITAVKQARYDDLIEKYENPILHACDVRKGMIWIANGWQKPDGFCNSAWESISPFVMTLAHGGENIYNGWMKNPKSAMISCNDGFRPVSFLIETLDEDAE